MNAYVRWRTLWLILLAGPLFIGCAGAPSGEMEEAVLLEDESMAIADEFGEDATNEDVVAFADDELASEGFDFEEETQGDDDDLLSELNNFGNEEVEELEEEAADATMSEVILEEEAPATQALAFSAPTETIYEESTSFLSRGDAGTPAAMGLPELGSKMPYVIQKGDTLSKVAKKIFGSYSKWKDIANLSGIENADLVYPGEVVYYQLTQESLAYAESQLKVEEAVQFAVVAKPGDTLSKIAEDYYGSRNAWAHIWQTNSQIETPDNLEVGTVIYLQKDLTPKNYLYKTEMMRERIKSLG